MPDIYRGPSTLCQQYGGLRGDLSIFLALMALSVEPDMLASLIPYLRHDAKWQCPKDYLNDSMYESISTSYKWLIAIQDFSVVVLSCMCTVARNQVVRPKIFKRMRPGDMETISIKDIRGSYFQSFPAELSWCFHYHERSSMPRASMYSGHATHLPLRAKHWGWGKRSMLSKCQQGQELVFVYGESRMTPTRCSCPRTTIEIPR